MQAGEKIATDSAPKKQKLYSCDWSSCKGKHEKEIQYPNEGKVTKSNYREKWINAAMQPWELHGKNKKRLKKDGSTYATMTYEYKTQAHHLVPTTLLKKTTTLQHNLKLVNYDCDGKENGMILPEFEMDIPLHELQAHRGNHPGGYMNPIMKELRVIEEAYDGICNDDVLGTMTLQVLVVKEIEALSNKARSKILNIKSGRNFWPLRSNALKEYKGALKEYARRELLHTQK